jgi:pimeloyl-ACP methyl ester carboxylesterase
MSSLRPFEVRIPDAALADCRARLAATRWFDDVYGNDPRYGVTRSFVRELCDHWLQAFDWRALEARINGEENVIAEINGLAIHALSRRSSRPDAVPILMIHGWPSSFLEFIDLLEPMAEPPPGEPAFHVVTPSLPGYGFSTTRPGVPPQQAAALFAELMARLGHERFMVQGGDWGFLVGTEIARQFPDRVIGLHLNLVNGSPPPDADKLPVTEEEARWVEGAGFSVLAHFALQSQVPAAAAYAFNDSPTGLAAWIGDKILAWTDNRAGPALPLDRHVATIALYWFTGTIASSFLLYWELAHNPPTERRVTVPTAGAIFPEEQVKIPRAWAEHHFNIVQWTRFDRGGHFAAMEVPELLIADVRRFARAIGA